MSRSSRIRKGIAKRKELSTLQMTGTAGGNADEVSASISAIFAAHAQEFNSLNAQATAFHNQFVSTLNSSAGNYAYNENH